ncbi:MAG: hypothetical protein A3K10_01990 [Bacteroidetes bacterium RIFCSPLOWO2_12_FULL_31_6]|nr:MAG: hypothetical protein A3K10_01990 [Bacteroidetes bacterium RIFCSPLOWO2_12_FULL_31_6]
MKRYALIKSEKKTNIKHLPSFNEVFKNSYILRDKLKPILSFDASICDESLKEKNMHFIRTSISESWPVIFQYDNGKYILPSATILETPEEEEDLNLKQTYLNPLPCFDITDVNFGYNNNLDIISIKEFDEHGNIIKTIMDPQEKDVQIHLFYSEINGVDLLIKYDWYRPNFNKSSEYIYEYDSNGFLKQRIENTKNNLILNETRTIINYLSRDKNHVLFNYKSEKGINFVELEKNDSEIILTTWNKYGDIERYKNIKKYEANISFLQLIVNTLAYGCYLFNEDITKQNAPECNSNYFYKYDFFFNKRINKITQFKVKSGFSNGINLYIHSPLWLQYDATPLDPDKAPMQFVAQIFGGIVGSYYLFYSEKYNLVTQVFQCT